MSDAERRPGWGLLPQTVVESIRCKYWDNIRNLKSLLGGATSFPIEVPLKPPSGSAALQNLGHFQEFVRAWKAFGETGKTGLTACHVRWITRTFRTLAEQPIPTHLVIPDIGALAQLLGPTQERQLADWRTKMTRILDSLSSEWDNDIHTDRRTKREQSLFAVLIDHLETLSRFDDSDVELFTQLVPQLHQGMGQGCYLRALPVLYVDTKYLEKNLKFIEAVVAAVKDESVTKEGLVKWLDCRTKPKDWLLVKPLSKKVADALGGLPLLRMSSETLMSFELPADNILVIENEQSCLALDQIHETIAVSGGGKNVSWMSASWLTEKRVGYWGDIDSEGLVILSDVRSKCSTVTPLMMDEDTLEAYKSRMVNEPDSVVKEPVALTETELMLFRKLRQGEFGRSRLEQERLPLDFVHQNIRNWLR